MRTNKNVINRVSIVMIFLFIFNINYAQQFEKNSLPALNIVPNGLTKTNFQLYSHKSEKLMMELGKWMEEKKVFDQKCKGLSANSPEEKQCQSELASLTSKLNELISIINIFNTEIEEIVYKDPSLDKLSMITYYTLKKDQKLWDEFQKNIANAKIKHKQYKVRIQQELTKIKSKKQKTKISFNEGIILSMYTEQDANKMLYDSLKSPFTGVTYNERNAKKQAKNITDSGVVIVSFVMPKQEKDPLEVASGEDNHSSTDFFSLASPGTKAELNRLKNKKFNRLIAHSNGATVVECLLNDSLIEVKEFNIIGGEKSLLNGTALQHLLDNGTVKRIVVWIKLDDPAVWITTLNEDDIAERTKNFISYKTKFDAIETKKDNSKVEYKWILNNGSLAVLNAQDPQFITTYFKEISKEFKSK